MDIYFQRLLQLVSMYCLMNANGYAYKFFPGNTYELVEMTKEAAEEIRLKIAALNNEAEVITIDSDSNESEMGVDDDGEPKEEENKENVM